LSFVDPKGLSASSEALRQAISKTVGGIAGKKCADSISCDFYKRALPYQLDSVINDQCNYLIPSGKLGHNYLECVDACSVWLKLNCNKPQSSCPVQEPA
jgi:hypothetical protein